MAVTVHALDWRIQVEPTNTGGTIGYGPLDTVPANAVMLTSENLRQVGWHAPRVSNDWDCELTLYVTSAAGVPTALGLAGHTVAGTYWDPIARVANTLTVALDVDQTANPGVFYISFADTDTTVAGMYRFQVLLTDVISDVYDLCTGCLELLPAIPS